MRRILKPGTLIKIDRLRRVSKQPVFTPPSDVPNGSIGRVVIQVTHQGEKLLRFSYNKRQYYISGHHVVPLSLKEQLAYTQKEVLDKIHHLETRQPFYQKMTYKHINCPNWYKQYKSYVTPT